MSKLPLFYSDIAIQSAAQDQLDRKQFARELANRLAVWNSDESLVLALYGPWGSGKSSIKNMALEYLRKDADSCPHIVEFNPWQISGQDQLTESFFCEIAVTLHKLAGDDPTAGERAEKWASYGTLLSVGGTVASSLKTILPLVGIPGGPLAGLAAEALKNSADLAGQGEKAARRAPKTLQSAKEELRRNFKRTLKKPVLVVIDDIDRLTFEEIRHLFRLVKANADFPRFIYLLLFQKNNAIKALDPVCDNQGAAYLEKIVQVGFDVPEIKRPALRKVLGLGIDEIMAPLKVGNRFNPERWMNLFIPELQHYFATLRDVYRFLNVFSFSVSSLSGGEHLEVNPVDLIATEVLRVFEHETFCRMASAKEFLTAHSGGGRDERKEVAEQLEALVRSARDSTRVRDILAALFPNLGGALGGTNYDRSFDPQWRRELRICHPANFDRYFFLTVAEGDISERDLAALVSDAEDRTKMVNHFVSLRDRGLLQAVFERLEGDESLLKLADPIPFLTAMYDIGDNLSEIEIGIVPLTMDIFIVWRTNGIVGAIETPERRLEVLKAAMTATSGLFAVIRIAAAQERTKEVPRDERKYLVSPEGAAELRGIALEKLRTAAKSGALLNSEHLGYMLFRWKDWAGVDEARAWTKNVLKGGKNVPRFLAGLATTGSSHTMGSYYQKRRVQVNLKSVEEFAELAAVTQVVEHIDRKKLKGREKAAVDAFLQVVARRKKGLSDEALFDSDEGADS